MRSNWVNIIDWFVTIRYNRLLMMEMHDPIMFLEKSPRMWISIFPANQEDSLDENDASMGKLPCLSHPLV